MKINDQVIGAVSQGLHKLDEFFDRPAETAHFQIIEPAFPAGNDHPVQSGMVHDQIRGSLFNDPGDVGVGEFFSQRGQGRQGMNHIADGAQFDHENVHLSLSLRIQRTASRMFPAI